MYCLLLIKNDLNQVWSGSTIPGVVPCRAQFANNDKISMFKDIFLKNAAVDFLNFIDA